MMKSWPGWALVPVVLGLPARLSSPPRVWRTEPVVIRMVNQSPARIMLAMIRDFSAKKNPLELPKSSHEFDLNAYWADRQKLRIWQFPEVRVSYSRSGVPSQLNSKLAAIPSVAKQVREKVPTNTSSEIQHKVINQFVNTTKPSYENLSKSPGEGFIQGRIQLHPEIPLGPGRSIEIFWESYDNKSRIPASFGDWDQPHLFHVQAPKGISGRIVARMMDEQLGVIGEGSYSTQNPLALAYYQTHPLIIRPTQAADQFEDWDHYFRRHGSGPARAPAVSRGFTQERGLMEERGVALLPKTEEGEMASPDPCSRILLKAPERSGKDSPLYYLKQSADSMGLLGLSKEMVESYRQWIKDLYHLPFLPALHIGQVRPSSNSREGVTGMMVMPEFVIPPVQWGGWEQHGYVWDKTSGVLYLNELFVPDPQLQETAPHGLFILWTAQSGLYPLRFISRHESGAQFITSWALVPDEGYGFGNVTFSGSQKRESYLELSTRSAFSQEFVPGILVTQRGEELPLARGKLSLGSKTLDDQSALVWVDPRDEWLSLRYFLPQAQDAAQCELSTWTKDWLEIFLRSNRLWQDGDFVGALIPHEAGQDWHIYRLVEGRWQELDYHAYDSFGLYHEGSRDEAHGFVIYPLLPYEPLLYELRYPNGQSYYHMVSLPSGQWGAWAKCAPL